MFRNVVDQRLRACEWLVIIVVIVLSFNKNSPAVENRNEHVNIPSATVWRFTSVFIMAAFGGYIFVYFVGVAEVFQE